MIWNDSYIVFNKFQIAFAMARTTRCAYAAYAHWKKSDAVMPGRHDLKDAKTRTRPEHRGQFSTHNGASKTTTLHYRFSDDFNIEIALKLPSSAWKAGHATWV